MIEAATSDVQSVEPTQSEEQASPQERRSDLADRMTESLLGEGPGEVAWDRQFPASCGKGWG